MTGLSFLFMVSQYSLAKTFTFLWSIPNWQMSACKKPVFQFWGISPRDMLCANIFLSRLFGPFYSRTFLICNFLGTQGSDKSRGESDIMLQAISCWFYYLAIYLVTTKTLYLNTIQWDMSPFRSLHQAKLNHDLWRPFKSLLAHLFL